MDAATLYIVLTLPNGGQQTSIQKFSTLEACEAEVELLRTVEPLDRRSPVTSYRCGGHNPFAFIARYRRGNSGRLVELPSRQACTAYQWITYLRDRSPRRLGYCFEDPPARPQKARLLFRGSPSQAPEGSVTVSRIPQPGPRTCRTTLTCSGSRECRSLREDRNRSRDCVEILL